MIDSPAKTVLKNCAKNIDNPVTIGYNVKYAAHWAVYVAV